MAAPVVSSVTPVSATTLGGVEINVFGTGFSQGATSVHIGGFTASDVVVQNDTFLTCISPQALTNSSGNVIVTNLGGSSATGSGNAFAFVYPAGDDVQYTDQCPYLDLFADYTLYGQWHFAIPPTGTGAGGGAWLLTGNTDATMASFLGNQNAVPLEIGTNGVSTLSIASDGSVVWSGQGAGLFWTLAAGLGQRFSLITMIAESELTLDSISQMDIGVTNADIINIGRSAATLTLTGPNVLVPGLANVITANAVYYNTTSGLFTYGAAGGGGTAWNVGGNALGATSVFGSTTNFGINFQVNSSSFLTVSSTKAISFSSSTFNADATGAVTLFTSSATSLQLGFTGMPVTVFGSAMTITSNAGVAINANAGSITLTSGGIFNTITLNGSVAFPTRIGLGNVHCSQIDIGNSATACPITVLCNTWLNTASTSYTVQSPVIRFGTTATNVSITLGGSTTSNLFGFGASISIHAGTSASFDSSNSVDVAATDALQLFLSNALCTTIFDATILQMPNMPAASGSGESYVVRDNTTKQLKAGSAAGGSYWSTAGNSGISGTAILGTLDNKTLFMQVNSTTILEVDSPSLDITMGVSTGAFVLNCSGGGLNAIGVASTFSIDSDVHLNLGANNAPAVTIGTAAWTTALNLWSTNSSIGMGTDLEIQSIHHINIGTGTPTSINFGAATCPMSINATTFTVTGAGAASISTSTGNLLLQTASGNATLATLAAGSANVYGVTTNIGVNAICTSLVLGNSNTALTSGANTWAINTVGTLHLGSGGAGDFSSGASVSLEAPAVNLNTASTTNVTTIGNVLASNNTVLNSINIKMPNIPSGTGGEKTVIIDSSTGQLRTTTAAAISWVDQTSTPVTMTTKTGYTSDNGVTLVVFTLPTSCTIGDTIEIQGKGSGLFRIDQAAGQQIFMGNISTTAGVTGHLASTLQYDYIRLKALTSGTTSTWSVCGDHGTFDLT